MKINHSFQINSLIKIILIVFNFYLRKIVLQEVWGKSFSRETSGSDHVPFRSCPLPGTSLPVMRNGSIHLKYYFRTSSILLTLNIYFTYYSAILISAIQSWPQNTTEITGYTVNIAFLASVDNGIGKDAVYDLSSHHRIAGIKKHTSGPGFYWDFAESFIRENKENHN